MSMVYLANFISVAVFGMVLSAAFCDISWSRKKYLTVAGSMAVILAFQGVICLWGGVQTAEYFYPLITHLPLASVLCILNKQVLWPIVSTLTAYLCCQLRRWLALLIVAVFSGDTMMQGMAELLVTVPLLFLILRFIAPSVRSVSCYSPSLQFQFGLVPAIYYGFDYLTRIYTNLLIEGDWIAAEFMSFVCSAAYLIFVCHISSERQKRIQLEQMQEILHLQVAQAVREMDSLRESQKKDRIFRHDLRHHLQHLSSCIENRRIEQAQEYIRGISSEMDASVVTVFCENEAANLIFSTFAGRAEKYKIPISITAGISQAISVAESDLCVLLSNMLENALHACRNRKERGLSGMIELLAYEKSGKLFLQCTNSCDSDITFQHGIPVTDRPGHGIGVRSICAIVERYGGIYDFSVKNNRFILRLSL